MKTRKKVTVIDKIRHLFSLMTIEPMMVAQERVAGMILKCPQRSDDSQ